MAVWELGSGDLERCGESALLERGVWSFGVALPALAPQHGTVERSMRLESEVMAPACHQKKIPPPGNTSRAGALITILACRVRALLACGAIGEHSLCVVRETSASHARSPHNSANTALES